MTSDWIRRGRGEPAAEPESKGLTITLHIGPAMKARDRLSKKMKLAINKTAARRREHAQGDMGDD